APDIKRPDVAFAITAGVLLDCFALALLADGSPDQGLNPIQAIEHHSIKLMLFSLHRSDLRQELADRFDWREPGAIHLVGAVLGADKDGTWRMACPNAFAHSIDAINESKDVPGTFAAGNGGENARCGTAADIGRWFGYHINVCVIIGY